MEGWRRHKSPADCPELHALQRGGFARGSCSRGILGGNTASQKKAINREKLVLIGYERYKIYSKCKIQMCGRVVQ